MALRSLARRWRGLAAVGAMASLVLAAAWVVPSRGDEKPASASSADSKSPDAKSTDASSKPGKGAVDPLAVPDGTPQQLLTFIGKVRSMRAPRKQSSAEAQALIVKRANAILTAADKILETKPEGKIRYGALQGKLQALAALDESGDDHAGTGLASLVDEIKDDKQPGLAKLAKKYAAQAADAYSATTTGKWEIKAPHLDGKPFDPSTVTRKVTLVELWATTCGACRAEMPNIERDYEKYHSRGFEVVSISMDTDKAAVEKFLKDNPKMSWQVLFAGGGTGLTLPTQAAGKFAIPKMVLINRRGVILSENISDKELTDKLEELLGS